MEQEATYRGTVYPWQCDHVGHMNIMWYVGKFDEANWNLFARLGLTPSYLRGSGRGMAAVQQNITYKRELLAGDLEDGEHGSVRWPKLLRPALSTVGFATELRDLLSRCAERGVDPIELQRIGRRAGRAEWLAAGQFAQVYEQVMLLRSAVGMAAPQATVPALGAAELVGAALEAFATDPDLLAAERARVRVLLVDDAQHLDPQAARLVRVLARGTDLTVIAGDPSQSVFGYRGADPALLRGDREKDGEPQTGALG
jgi:hypothetical protein